MKKFLGYAVLTISVFGIFMNASPVQAQSTEVEIRQLIEDNFRVTQEENIEAMMAQIHTQSPIYLQTRETSGTIFDNYDLAYTMVEFGFIGEEGGYAYARVKQLTEKVNGPAFQDNELDAVHIFKQEDGTWKFWNMAVLDIAYKN